MADPRLTVGSRRNQDGSYTLPSGASAAINGLTVRQLDKLGNRKKLKTGAAYNEILAECAGIDPAKALIGDRVFSLIAVRVETLGSDYEVRCKCPACGNQFVKAVDLDTLSVQELKHGVGPFEFTLPKSGKKLTYRLLTGQDEQRLTDEFGDELEQHGLSLTLALRTTAVEGEPVVSRQFFERLAGRDAAAYRDDIDEHDCGVDTAVEVECPKCENSFQGNINLDPTFLLPPKKARN